MYVVMCLKWYVCSDMFAWTCHYKHLFSMLRMSHYTIERILYIYSTVVSNRVYIAHWVDKSEACKHMAVLIISSLEKALKLFAPQTGENSTADWLKSCFCQELSSVCRNMLGQRDIGKMQWISQNKSKCPQLQFQENNFGPWFVDSILMKIRPIS